MADFSEYLNAAGGAVDGLHLPISSWCGAQDCLLGALEL